MSVRKIFIISPVEPSGVTWLINCLLELGLKTYRFDADNMWVRRGAHYALKPNEDVLKKWLPAFYDHSDFSFRPDIEFEWAHDWPTARYDGYTVLYFVRDPRESFFSAYKRTLPNMSFSEFVSFPHVSTLFNRIDNWCFYTLSWLARPQTHFFRFEDYRNDDANTLKGILKVCGLVYDDASIQKALIASTYQKAAQAEQRYLSENEEFSSQVLVRRTAAQAYKEEILPRNIAFIEERSSDVLARLGYACENGRKRVRDHRFHVEALSYFKSMYISPSLLRAAQNPIARQVMIEEVLRFSDGEKDELLSRSGLSEHEMKILKDSLSEFKQYFLVKRSKPAFFNRVKNLFARLR